MGEIHFPETFFFSVLKNMWQDKDCLFQYFIKLQRFRVRNI